MGEGKGDVQGAERHDERGQAQAGDQCAVECAKRRAHQKAQSDGQDRVEPGIDRERRHHDGAERHDRAIGQVDARRQDDQRLTDGQCADDHDLLNDQ